MEKNNKYYNIIADIVKKHRKYSGLEAILDDIIDDVYNHSEVIINSVPNESVISAYLEKVVATSIITVPKKMGFHPEIKHATVSSVTQQLQQSSVSKEVVKKVDNTLVDKMINSAESTSSDSTESDLLELASDKSELNDIVDKPIQEEQEPSLNSIDDDVLTDEFDAPAQDYIEDNDLLVLSEKFEENDLSSDVNEVLPADNQENLDIENHDEKNDIDELSTEDLEINNAPESDESKNDFLQEQVEDSDFVVEKADDIQSLDYQHEDDVLEEISDKDDLLDNFVESKENDEKEPLQEAADDIEEVAAETNEEVVLENGDSSDDLNLDEVESPMLNFVDESGENLNPEVSSEEVDTDESPIEEVEQNDLELQISDEAEPLAEVENPVEDLLPKADETNDDVLQTEESENFELEQSGNDFLQVEGDDSFDLESVDDNLAFSDELTLDSGDELLESTESDGFELNLNEEAESPVELEIVGDAKNEESEQFAVTDFSKFNFNPENVDINDTLDTDLIVKDIQDLANKRPELKIIDVYNMKYKDNKSVSDISTELGMDENSVIDALNEIIAVI